MKKELIDLECILEHETDKAWLFDFGEAEPVWVPKSIGSYEHHEDFVTVPLWFAKDKGLV